MSHPVIGITCSRSVGGQWSKLDRGHFVEFAYDLYSQAVISCGGAPLLIPISQNKASLGAICDRVDGLILTGGPDINPRFYKDEARPGLGDVDEQQDETELALTRLALSTNTPVLGICRGLQVLNVAMGGTLYQDIALQVPESNNHSPKTDRGTVSHKIEIKSGTRLHAILKRHSLWVNSKHHQAVKDPAPGLIVSAMASDGVIEALEDPARPFVLAVQWHPEGLWRKDPAAKRLFKAFIAGIGQ